jgi:hypothetical protein
VGIVAMKTTGIGERGLELLICTAPTDAVGVQAQRARK